MYRKFSRRRATLAMLATAAGIPAFAASAQASLTPGTGIPILKGQVTLETVPFGFLGTMNPDGVSDVNFMGGEAKFTWYRGAVAGHLTGTMHVDNGQLAQYRVRVDALTGNNDEIDDPVYDKKAGTSPSSASQDIPVDISVPSAPNLVKMKVVLEEKSSSPKWVERGEYYTQAVPRTDDVKILSKHLDVGGIGFANGEPTDDASVTWDVGDDGALTATYRGYLHFTGAAASGRVELRSIDPLLGTVSATEDGDTHETNGNGPVVSPQDTITLTSSSSPTVEVVMQSWVPTPDGGHWDDIASQTVSAGE
jgi:hypothetical protein